MALYWPEARVAIVCSGAEDAGGGKDWPPEVLVVLMREGQQDCPEFVNAVRDLVGSRTMEHRCRALDALYELGTVVPEPEGGNESAGEDPSEAQRAEAALREKLKEGPRGAGADEEQAGDDEDIWGWGRYPSMPESLSALAHLGEWDAPETQVVINHCDEVVVSR